MWIDVKSWSPQAKEVSVVSVRSCDIMNLADTTQRMLERFDLPDYLKTVITTYQGHSFYTTDDRDILKVAVEELCKHDEDWKK